MYLDVEVSRVGLFFCLQSGGAEQQAEYGNELFHLTFPQGLKPGSIRWRCGSQGLSHDLPVVH
jgi:hypothetical protein